MSTTSKTKRLSITIPQSLCAELHSKCATPGTPFHGESFANALETNDTKHPSSKITSNYLQTTNNSKKYCTRSSLFNKTGIRVHKKIATTLQGSVYDGFMNDGKRVIIKRTSCELHKNSFAILNNKKILCSENIVKEASILRYLQSKLPNNITGLIKLITFFCDDINYFLIMEHGGNSLFHHATKLHEKIYKKKLTNNEYLNHLKIIFYQMSQFIYWMHETQKCCHLDISLENMVIKGFKMKNGKILKHGTVSFIDFGLAKSFVKQKSFKCRKFVGKKPYRSPLNYANKTYDAAKNDVWSLGVCMFMLTFGIQPYIEPTKKCKMFLNIINGYINKYINEIGKMKFANKLLLNLLNNMLSMEYKRYTIKDVINDQFFK